MTDHFIGQTEVLYLIMLISLKEIIIPTDNSYGISKNKENSKYFAGFQFHDYHYLQPQSIL